MPTSLIMLPRKQAELLRDAIAMWRRAGLLPDTQAEQLSATVITHTFDWRRLAKYSFWVAIVSIVIAVGAALSDRLILALLQKLLDAPAWIRCLAWTGLAAALYRLGLHYRAHDPMRHYRNEAVMFLGVLATAGAIVQLGIALDNGSGHVSLLALLASFVYAVIAVRVESSLIWVFALLALGSWMGTETGYQSGWGAYYLGMNYPLRFVLFGALLTAAAMTFGRHPAVERFHHGTLVMGLLYLFIALWIMSIFGNYGDRHRWEHAKQIELFHWSLLFGLVACGAIYHGLRYDNGTTKGFGLTFLFINLYTRFFELFWNSLHKAIFFALLGLGSWYLGTKAETIWNIGRRETREASDT